MYAPASWSVLSVTLGVWMGGGRPVHPWSDCLLYSTKKLLKVVDLSRSELMVFPSHSKSETEVLRRDITMCKLRRLNATPCSSTVSSY